VEDGTVAGEGPDPDSNQGIFRQHRLRGRNGENQRRLEAGSKLQVLAITVDNTCAAMAIGSPSTTPMPLTKIPGTNDPFSPVKLLKDSWIISDNDFQKVSNFVKANGCPVGA
jgi:hypothetical protein